MTDTTMNTGAASLSDEQIEALKAAALAATPQDIDSAQRIEHYEDGSHMGCPACGGEGYVELNAGFCNYDGEAMGVQFYGIGNAHVLAEAYFRAVKPATVLTLIERLERAEATATPQADAAIAAGGAQEAVAMSADECAQDVYKHGKSIGLFDIPKEAANAICAGISTVTGARVDWHYIAGRVHMKALPRVAATVVLTDEQRKSLEHAIWNFDRNRFIEDAKNLRALLAASNGEQ
jgi:hypothetical protein